MSFTKEFWAERREQLQKAQSKGAKRRWKNMTPKERSNHQKAIRAGFTSESYQKLAESRREGYAVKLAERAQVPIEEARLLMRGPKRARKRTVDRALYFERTYDVKLGCTFEEFKAASRGLRCCLMRARTSSATRAILKANGLTPWRWVNLPKREREHLKYEADIGRKARRNKSWVKK